MTYKVATLEIAHSWNIATWKKSFGKVPNMIKITCLVSSSKLRSGRAQNLDDSNNRNRITLFTMFFFIIVYFINAFSNDTLFQGYNTRKVISEVYASFVCSVLSLGGNVNTRRMSQPDMRSIFHIKSQ